MEPGTFFARHQSTRALAHRDFRLLLLGTTTVGFVMPIQFLTQVFWVQAQYPSRSVLYVGLIAASRGSAMLFFSLVGGAIADRFERRRVLLFCESTALALNVVIAALMITEPFGEATVAALLVLTFLAAGNMAIDQPTRSASTPAIVGMTDLANGIGLQMMAVQLTTPLSLPLVGLLNARFDPGHVYAGSLVAWLAILPLISALRFRNLDTAKRSEGMLGNIRSGLAYTRRDPAISGIILLILILQVVGMPGPATLGPIWMTEVLGLSKSQFGLMAMTWGIGAATASVFFARNHGLTRSGRSFSSMVLLFALGTIVFSHSRLAPLTAVVNFWIGFALVGTMVSASTMVQFLVSDEMRGRVLGLFPLAMGLAMLDAAPVSALGQVFGLEAVLPVLAWATLGLCLLVIARQPLLRARAPHIQRTPVLEAVELP
jgi:MFS family permease